MTVDFEDNSHPGENLPIDECRACGKQSHTDWTSRGGDWRTCWECEDTYCRDCAANNLSPCADCEDTFCNDCLSITTDPEPVKVWDDLPPGKRCQGCIDHDTVGVFRGDIQFKNKSNDVFERAWGIVKSRDWRSEGRDALEDLFDWDWDDHDLHPWDGSHTEGSWRQVKPTGNWVWKRPRPDNEQPRTSGLSSNQLHLDTDPAWILYQSGYPIMPELTDAANSWGHWADIPITVQPRGDITRDQIEALRQQQGESYGDHDLSQINDILALPEVALAPYYQDITPYNVADFSRNPLIGDEGVRGATHPDEKYKYIFDAVQQFNDLLDRDARIEESIARIPDQDLEIRPWFDHPHSEVLERINNQIGFYEGDEMRIDDIATLENMRDIAEGLEDWGF
tara:strand:+ start:273 stop:1457 length:1185 start_codon:yes stop_codon:yes gene_type:complete